MFHSNQHRPFVASMSWLCPVPLQIQGMKKERACGGNRVVRKVHSGFLLGAVGSPVEHPVAKAILGNLRSIVGSD